MPELTKVAQAVADAANVSVVDNTNKAGLAKVPDMHIWFNFSLKIGDTWATVASRCLGTIDQPAFPNRVGGGHNAQHRALCNLIAGSVNKISAGLKDGTYHTNDVIPIADGTTATGMAYKIDIRICVPGFELPEVDAADEVALF